MGFVGDGDFTKMFGWGMELLVFTTYRKSQEKWYRNIEMCKGEVTSLLGKIISLICSNFPQFKEENLGPNGKFQKWMKDKQPKSTCPDKGKYVVPQIYGHQGAMEISQCKYKGVGTEESRGFRDIECAYDTENGDACAEEKI